MSFNVGSVFKPIVAVSYLEGVKRGFTANCTGLTLIGEKEFACHKREGHGTVNLYDALAFSCNSFFYELASLLKAENIVKTASLFGFGYKKELCKGIETANEKMPEISDLESKLSIANLSIGQGSLMASPVTLLSLYEAIANGGIYHKPTVVEGIMKNGVTEYEKEPSKIKAMSKNTADIIKTALRKVTVDGTAQSVLSDVDGAGKTATAQTGQKKDGREVEHSWFCGFFPYENPEYVVSIIVEDSIGKEKQAMEIFKELSLNLLNR
jgi:cell division protein FtsI/penicillin-binding protein 2